MTNVSSKQDFQPETRRSLRIEEQLPITWRLKEENISGIGRIRNISDSGAMLETNTEIPVRDNCLLAIAPSSGLQVNYLPTQGRLVWIKKRNFGGQRFLGGVEFIEPAQEVITNLREAIKSKIKRVKSMERTKNVVGTILGIALIALTAFALWQQIAIQKDYEQSTELLLGTAAQQVDLYTDVSNDLKETKTILAQTEAMLTQVKEQNLALQNELQAANVNIAALRDDNTKLSKEVSDLQERLKPFEAEVGTMDEGKSFLSLVRQRLRDIKIGINSVKRKAYLAKIAAQKERDKILLAQGNQGYLVKDSKPVTSSFPTTKPEKKVRISVNLFE